MPSRKDDRMIILSFFSIPNFLLFCSHEQITLDEATIYQEKEVLAKVAEGDQEAFRRLYEQYHRQFMGACVQLSGSQQVAEEVVQEAFIRIWEKRVYLANLDHPRGYLFKIFNNTLFEYYRYVAGQRKIEGAYITYYEQQSADEVHDKLQLEAQLAMVQASLQHLTPQQLRVFQLIREKGLSRKEAAEALGISPNTVRNLLAEAMRVLREHNTGIHPFVLLSVLLFK